MVFSQTSPEFQENSSATTTSIRCRLVGQNFDGEKPTMATGTSCSRNANSVVTQGAQARGKDPCGQKRGQIGQQRKVPLVHGQQGFPPGRVSEVAR